MFASHSNTSQAISAALFQDLTAGALAATIGNKNAVVDTSANITFTHYMVAGTASATTFKVRAGADVGGTLTFNGSNASRLFGGVSASSITITEIGA